MKLINKIKNNAALFVIAGVLFASCNKVLETPIPIVIPPNPASGISLAATITANADDSLFNRLVIRTNTQFRIDNKLNRYTVFVPNNAAMRNFVNAASGGLIPVASPDAVHSNFLNTTLPIAVAGVIVNYNISPQEVTSATITSTFPNFAYPSNVNPNPMASGLLRLNVYPSKRSNGAWLNNIPLVPGIDVATANGVIHHTAAVTAIPNSPLWSRINSDVDMTYLRAAIIRADSGTTSTPGTLNSASLQSVLTEFGPNLTVFAPTNAAFIATLTGAIYQGLVAQGFPAGAGTLATATALVTATDANGPTVFRNPLLFSVLTCQAVQGIVIYHVLGDRAFSVNFPTTTTNIPTLLNRAVPTHPGVGITATFTGPGVTAITVKGLGNPSAFPVSVNPTPNPFGASDQHFINGVLHKLNGVLLPQ